MNTIAIIGGGPAGYVAAITAARQGKQVVLVEERELGGTCLNEGCMPTKSLLESAEMAEKVKQAKRFGVKLPPGAVEINWSGVQGYKNKIIKKLVLDIGYLMKKNQIKVLKGRACFIDPHHLKVEDGAKQEVIEADKIIIASGSEPIPLPFAPFDGKWVIHSGQAMSPPSIPPTLLIVGGGVIGCEFASIYSRMGTKVTMVEMADQLLPGEDADIAAILQKELEKEGVAIHLSTTLKTLNADAKQATFENKDGSHHLHAEYVLVSIGRKPRVAGLGMEEAGISFSSQGIPVNAHMQTLIPHIYACGDVIGGAQLAHVAFHGGTVAALHACGEEAKANYRAVPRCIYTSPEMASVGMTEKQAREQYGDIRVGELPFTANGKALILDEQIGKVKVMVEPQYGEIIGLSLVGPRAAELIGQGTLMLHTEMTADILKDFIAAHPTLSEAIHEALLGATEHAVHA